jgi:hypothetical protein
MALLDRFRAHPRQKHPDPAVRLAYVEEIPLDERDAIFAMAREDEDPRVRKAAVAKLMDPRGLSEIVQHDQDKGVRDRAVAMLGDIALDAFEGVSETESLDAVDALGDPKLLAHIAKTALREIVALRALSRLTDGRAIGSIARHAPIEAVRLDAFERLRERGDRAEMVNIAMNSEYKDTAVAAVDVLGDGTELEDIASGSRNKSAAKRARTILREREEGARAALEAAKTEEARHEPARIEESKIEEIEQVDPEAERAKAEAEERRVEAERQQEAEQHARAEAQETERARARELAEEAARRDEERRRELAAREAEAREADARTRKEALARVQQLATRVEALQGRADLTLKAADRALRDIREMLAHMPSLPSRQDFDDMSSRLKAAQAALQPRAHELHEADDWQRWANVTVQEELCARMEALGAIEDPDAIAREVHQLQMRWRGAANVPRAQADALWRRFKAAHDAVWPRCESHFAAQAQARAENLARKTALCERVEALAESTRWIETAETIKVLQAEWKTIGAVSRGREKAVWDRFRAACDRFFTRRHEDLALRKKQWGENLAKKEALIARAEALAESTDWEPTAAEMRQLQAEWKSVGPVKKNRSEAIWQRFRSATDSFFSRYAQRHDTARAERAAARESICAELEAVLEAPPDDILAAVRSVRARWQQETASRGVEPERARVLDARFAAAHAAVLSRWPEVFAGTDLDPDANRKKMESLVKRAEDLAASLTGPAHLADDSVSPTTRLAAMLKEALAANTIGGKADDSSRFRAAAEELRQVQASWSRIGPVADAVRAPLAARFQRACQRVAELTRSGSMGRAGR